MPKFLHLKKISSIKSLLLYWFIGSGLLLVVIYTALMEYSFRFGVEIRTQAIFERYASAYEKQYLNNVETALPSGPNLYSYRKLNEVPIIFNKMFPVYSFEHSELETIPIDELPNSVVLNDLPKCDGVTCEIIFFYSHQLKDDSWLYMIQGVLASDNVNNNLDFIDYFNVLVTIIILLSFAFVAFLLVRKISTPVQQLANWAEKLTIASLDEPIPEFEFNELNQMANKLNKAFERVGESMAKEHRFLQHASHELRTPLATASGNLDILAFAGKNNQRSTIEENAISRLNYAINEMKILTETLLWLNRDLETLPDKSTFDLKLLVDLLVEENSYLTENKSLRIEVNGGTSLLESYETLCTIVVTNLIRNAFQYTYEGRISITLMENSINITNENNDVVENKYNDDEYGFGLGLDLVQQITDRLGWGFDTNISELGHSTTVCFDSI